MPVTDHKQFVKSQKLATPSHYSNVAVLGSAHESDTSADKPSAFLNNRSIVSFVSGVAGQARRDVLNATLFAQLAADHDYPRLEQPDAWLKRYTEVLTTIGWNLQGGERRTYSSSLSDFDMNQAMLKIMGGALVGPGGYIAVIQATLDALKDLGKNADDIKLFHQKMEQLNTNTFQLGIASETDEAVALTISTFEVKTNQGERNILFFKGKKDEVGLVYHVTQGSLNPDVYGRVRQDVVQMLGDHAQKAVKGIQLA